MSVETTKRQEEMSLPGVQQGNKSWWTDNTMSYDWKDQVNQERFGSNWFEEIDARFIYSARLFGHDQKPFDRIIPFAQLAGKRVLEIGCGMGLHTELMVRAGAQVTAIDLSPTSVKSTKTRLAQRGLAANVIEFDAEKFDAPNGSFDFVWSWGVIHHSARTGRIVRNIARMLTPDGEFRSMVYNRDGYLARYVFLCKFLLGGRFRRNTYDEVLFDISDGFSARFYPPEQYADLLSTFFADVRHEVMGQDSDALPLPRRLRELVKPMVGEKWLKEQQKQRGAFIFAVAKNVV